MTSTAVNSKFKILLGIRHQLFRDLERVVYFRRGVLVHHRGNNYPVEKKAEKLTV